MRLFRYGNVFAQASSQFCRHMDEYLVADTRGISGLSISRRASEGAGICSVAMRMGGSSRSGGSVSHHPRRGSRAASSSTFPYGLYRQKEYLPLLTTTDRAGRAPEKLLLPLTSGYEWPRLILLEGYRRKV